MKETMAQKIRFGILASVGILALFIMAGEDQPGNPMSDAQFFISKGAAALVIYGCYRLGKRWKRMGLIADPKEEEGEDLW